MNWLQKICQETYVDVGHGYSTDSGGDRQQSGIRNTIIWWYRDGRIFSKEARLGKTHGDLDENTSAWKGSGRVEFDRNLGSITFLGNKDTYTHKEVIEAVISKFPGIKFYIFDFGKTHSAQEYWSYLTQGDLQ